MSTFLDVSRPEPLGARSVSLGRDRTTRGVHLGTKAVLASVVLLVLALGSVTGVTLVSSVHGLRLQAEEAGRQSAAAALAGFSGLREPSAANIARTLDVVLDDQLRAVAAATALLVEAAEVGGRSPGYLNDALAQIAFRSPVRAIDVIGREAPHYTSGIETFHDDLLEPEFARLLSAPPAGATAAVPARYRVGGLFKAAAAQTTHRPVIVRIEHVLDPGAATTGWSGADGTGAQDLAAEQARGLALLLAHGMELAAEAGWSVPEVNARLGTIVDNTTVKRIEVFGQNGAPVYSAGPAGPDGGLIAMEVPLGSSIDLGEQRSWLLAAGYDAERRWIAAAAALRGTGSLGVAVSLATRAGEGSLVQSGWQAEADRLVSVGDVRGVWVVRAGPGGFQLAAAAPRPGTGGGEAADAWSAWSEEVYGQVVSATEREASVSLASVSLADMDRSRIVSAARDRSAPDFHTVVLIEASAPYIAAQMRSVLSVGLGSGFLLLCLTIGAASWGARRWVTGPLEAVAESTVVLTGGTRPECLPGRLLDRRDELGTLGRSFEAMADEVLARRDELQGMVDERTASLRKANDELTNARRHLDHDFDLAKSVQTALVPTGARTFGRFELCSRVTPAGDLGGDFVSVLPRDDGRVLFALCDVSGKGVAAALFMACAQGALAAAASDDQDLRRIVADMNVRLCRRNESKMFVTGVVGVLDPGTGVVEYVCAGHEPAIVLKPDGAVEKLESTDSLALGLLDLQEFESADREIRPGDAVVFYTDGVTDAADPSDEAFGEGRLQNLVAGHAGASAQELVDVLWNRIAQFADGTPAPDDKTALVVRCVS